MSPTATKRIADQPAPDQPAPNQPAPNQPDPDQDDSDRAGSPKSSGPRGTKSGVRKSLKQASSSSSSSSSSARASASGEVEWTAELDELGKAFRHVFRSLNRLRGRDTHLGGTELSHAQFELLIELHERGELAAGELAAAARLTPATVTQMLEHLAECGHVERVRSDIDRRVVVSRLTPQGKRQIEAKRAAWQKRWQVALEGVPPRELRAATRVLGRLAGAFEDAPARGPCPQSPGRPEDLRA
jgi:MarR family transcriptional regulator, organic hydroperoxide resistance regulator